jgi:hypothetical protein
MWSEPCTFQAALPTAVFAHGPSLFQEVDDCDTTGPQDNNDTTFACGLSPTPFRQRHPGPQDDDNDNTAFVCSPSPTPSRWYNPGPHNDDDTFMHGFSPVPHGG